MPSIPVAGKMVRDVALIRTRCCCIMIFVFGVRRFIFKMREIIHYGSGVSIMLALLIVIALYLQRDHVPPL